MGVKMDKYIDNLEYIGANIGWVAYWVYGFVSGAISETITVIVGLVGGCVLIWMNYQKGMKILEERRILKERNGRKDQGATGSDDSPSE